MFNLNQNRGVNMKVKEDLTMSIILNYATDTLGNMNWFISAFLITSSLTLFYLEDFKLSNIRLIKYIQIFSFVCIPFYIIYYMFNIFNPSLTDLITYMADNKDVNLHGHVKIDKEAGKAIGQGLQTIGTQTITDGSSTVTTVLPIPPVNVEFVPNPDVIMQIVDISNKGYYYIDRASALADMMGLGFM